MSVALEQLTIAIQQYTKFVNEIRKQDGFVIEEAYGILNQLQQQKSKLEGSESPIQEDPSFGQTLKHPRNSFSKLKSFVKGNTLQDLEKHPNLKETMIQLVIEALGPERELLYLSLCCSPWFAHTQDDRQSKGRKNSIFFVFRQHSRFCLGVENQHANRRSELFTIDGTDEWMIGREIRSFVEVILTNQYRYVVELSNNRNVLYQSETWKSLRDLTSNGKVFRNTRQFLERTTAQGIALISVRDKKQKVANKKQKKNQRKYAEECHFMANDVRQDVALFCECFQLLFDVARVYMDQEPLDWNEWERIETPPEPNIARPQQLSFESFSETIKNYQELIRYHLCATSYTSCKESDYILYESAFKLVELLTSFQKECLPVFSYSTPAGTEELLQEWLANVRLRYVEKELTEITVPVSFDCVQINSYQKDFQGLKALIKDIGPPLEEFQPTQILFLIENGSRMYDVAVESSDRDYVAVYRSDTKSLLSGLQWPKESIDNRGHSYEIEHCCYEVRMFCELLLKGNPSVIELLFSDRVAYMSNAWKMLVDKRQDFISEAVVFQYVSWVKFHLKLVRKAKQPNKAPKYFYHAFHKLFELERLLRREPIAVQSEGEEREFIVNVRSGSFKTYMLKQKAQHMLADIEARLAARTWRYPESGDWRFLQQWVLSIRRFSV